MPRNYFVYVPLVALVLAGFWGALSISYDNLNSTSCPHVFLVPVCYVVAAAYASMLAALAIPQIHCKHYFFVAGWAVAFIIAVAGSLGELFAGGGVCPTSGGGRMGSSSAGGIPMCYLSLAMLLVILALFIIGPYRRACARQSSPVT